MSPPAPHFASASTQSGLGCQPTDKFIGFIKKGSLGSCESCINTEYVKVTNLEVEAACILIRIKYLQGKSSGEELTVSIAL